MTAAQSHTFGWPGAIARNCNTLLRIVAALFIQAGLDEDGADTLPPAVRAGVGSRIQAPVLVQKRTARM
jgi:hypothetical protein